MSEDCYTALIVLGVVVLIFFVMFFLSRCDICGKQGGTSYSICVSADGGYSLRAHDECLVEIQKNPHNFSDDAVDNAGIIFEKFELRKRRADSMAKESEITRKRLSEYEPFHN